jgi:6-phosphogluconolactonase
VIGGPSVPADEAQDEPQIRVLLDSEAASELAAAIISEQLIHAVAERGRADWATTGGSTPSGIYARLAVAPLRDGIPWDRVHIWWGDDRWVPRSDILSNAWVCDDVLLNLSGRHDWPLGTEPGAPIPLENVHVIPIDAALAAGQTPAWAAIEYERTLRGAGLEIRDGMPVLDIVLVGIGSDGHLLSVFPGSRTWEDAAWVQAVLAPEHIAPHVDRVTLHPRVVPAARMVLAVLLGARKAEIAATIFGPQRDVHRWPAQLARRPGATWILDAAASGGLPDELRG